MDWLLAHVDGFTSRRDARQWATNALLRPGLIRHTLNKNTFSEQCYYVFTELAAQAEYQLQLLEREFELAGGTSSSQTLTAAGAGAAAPGASANNTSGLGGTGASNGGGAGAQLGAMPDLSLQQMSLKSADAHLFTGTTTPLNGTAIFLRSKTLLLMCDCRPLLVVNYVWYFLMAQRALCWSDTRAHET